MINGKEVVNHSFLTVVLVFSEKYQKGNVILNKSGEHLKNSATFVVRSVMKYTVQYIFIMYPVYDIG